MQNASHQTLLNDVEYFQKLMEEKCILFDLENLASPTMIDTTLGNLEFFFDYSISKRLKEAGTPTIPMGLL